VYCGQCGTRNQDEAGHCDTCGAPLLITTGARSCGNCGAALGDHDRFCTTCGTAAADATDSADSYDASDDFGEIDIEDIQLDELPDWLQSMAPSPQKPSEQPTSAPPSHTGAQPDPDDLPDWLRDSPGSARHGEPHAGSAKSFTPPPPPSPGAVSHQPADEFSLVSDEDLPDWLKALSDEDESSSTPPPAQPVAARPSPSRPSGEPTRAVANLYEVPAISRAWQTQGRSVNQEQITSARQEFAPLEVVSSVATEQVRRESIWDSEPEQTAEDSEETRPFVVAQEEESSEGAGRGQLIVRIIILALVVIVVLLLAFVLIQGV
jgi:hypothetical protein